MRFEFFIAARYLRAKRRQAVVGIITVISVIGVTAGVASLIIALAITNGMRRDMQERLLGSTAHIDLMRVAADGIKDWRPLLERLRALPHVTAAAPGLYGQVLISRGARSGGGLIKGVIPAEERTVGDLLQKVQDGSAEPLNPAPAAPAEGTTVQALPPIVIGNDLAETIGAKVGDAVLVTSPQGELTPLGLVPKYQRCVVAGIFKSGFYQYDASYAFMRLMDAQRLFSEPDLISVISFKVDDLYKADRIAREIEQAAGKGFQTTNWMEQAFSCAEAGTDRNLHRTGADCVRGCAEHSDCADHDGNGKDTRYSGPDELWRNRDAGAEDLSFARAADLSDRDRTWTGPWLCCELGGRALPVPSGCGGVLAGLSSVRSTGVGWRDRGNGIAGGQPDRNNVSERKRSEGTSGGGAAI
jgi:hypothetical protein